MRTTSAGEPRSCAHLVLVLGPGLATGLGLLGRGAGAGEGVTGLGDSGPAPGTGAGAGAGTGIDERGEGAGEGVGTGDGAPVGDGAGDGSAAAALPASSSTATPSSSRTLIAASPALGTGNRSQFGSGGRGGTAAGLSGSQRHAAQKGLLLCRHAADFLPITEGRRRATRVLVSPECQVWLRLSSAEAPASPNGVLSKMACQFSLTERSWQRNRRTRSRGMPRAPVRWHCPPGDVSGEVCVLQPYPAMAGQTTCSSSTTWCGRPPAPSTRRPPPPGCRLHHRTLLAPQGNIATSPKVNTNEGHVQEWMNGIIGEELEQNTIQSASAAVLCCSAAAVAVHGYSLMPTCLLIGLCNVRCCTVICLFPCGR